MESSQITPAVLNRIETLQLKVFRKILRMDITYINRANTNNRVFEEANKQSNEERKRKIKIVTILDAYRKQK